ncbi:MAG: molybdopterin-dependent oxidoreductase [Haloplanus sp.]
MPSHSEMPADVAPTRWMVIVAGAVSKPTSSRATDLRAIDSVRVDTSADCEGDGSVQRWSGVRVGSLLDRAGPYADASHALVRSADPDFACGFDLDRLRSAILAVQVDGDPVPPDRGGPIRLIPDDPDADCWERVKWVSRIEVLDGPAGEEDTARELVEGEDGDGS